MVHGLGRERFGKNTGAMCFNEVFQYSWSKDKPVEDVWREWVKKVSKLPTRSVSAQALEQLTISGLARHGQTELENQLILRAPLSVAKRSNTGLRTPDASTSGFAGTRMGPGRSVASFATWHPFVETPLARPRRAKAKVRAKERRVKAERKGQDPRDLFVARKVTRRQTVLTRIGHVRVVERLSDDPVPEAVVAEAVAAEVRCVAVSDGHCDCKTSSQCNENGAPPPQTDPERADEPKFQIGSERADGSKFEISSERAHGY